MNGTEPDFSMTQSDYDSISINHLVTNKESGAIVPSLKYEVSVCFVQKKNFLETDLIEACGCFLMMAAGRYSMVSRFRVTF